MGKQPNQWVVNIVSGAVVAVFGLFLTYITGSHNKPAAERPSSPAGIADTTPAPQLPSQSQIQPQSQPQPPASISVRPGLAVITHQSEALPIAVKDKQGRTLTDIPIAATVTPPALGTWSDNVFMAGSPGSGTLFIAAGGLTATVDIAVTTAQAASMVAHDFTVMAGTVVDLPVKVMDAFGNEIQDMPVTARIEPEDLGTYAFGQFTAGLTVQTGTITLISGDVSKEIRVTVIPATGP